MSDAMRRGGGCGGEFEYLRGGFERIAKQASHNTASQPASGTIEQWMNLYYYYYYHGMKREDLAYLPTWLAPSCFFRFIHSFVRRSNSKLQAGSHCHLFVFAF